MIVVDLIVLDDFGLAGMTDEQRRDLLDVLEDCYERNSTLVTSRLPVKRWHELLADPTLAAAILDHLVHNADRGALAGESTRKKRRWSTDDEAIDP